MSYLDHLEALQKGINEKAEPQCLKTAVVWDVKPCSSVHRNQPT
jgi:hypothetical protein